MKEFGNSVFKLLSKIKRGVLDSLSDNKNIFSVFYHIILKSAKSLRIFFSEWVRNHYKVFLWLILAIAFFIRFGYMKWGLPYLYEWDEPYIVNKTIQIMQTSDFNTHFFHYPALNSYILLPFFILNYYRIMGNLSLDHLQHIAVQNDSGIFHYISHPSFYAVGRLIMCFFAVGCILLIYEIGKRFFNRKVGLISALVLTFIPFHRSVSITPNMPVAFFVLLSLFFLSLYIQKKRIGYVFLAGLSAGFAVASKYNSFPILFPLIIGIFFYSKRKWRDTLVVLSSSGFGFFLGCPYALFDLKNFLDQTGREVQSYTGGERGYEGNPGMEQIKFFLSHFREWIQNTFYIRQAWILSVIGVIGHFVLDIRNFIVVFSFPLLYILYMSQQRTNFIRNMLCITPFIALSAALALYYGFKLLLAGLNSAKRKGLMRLRISREAVFMGCFFLVFFWLRPIGIVKNTFVFMKIYKEVRTETVEYAKTNLSDSKIGISNELLIHPNDLDKIPNKVIFNTEKISLDNLYLEGFDYIISSDKYSCAKEKHRIKNADRIKLLESKFPKQNIIKSFGTGPVNLDGFMIDPKINIYKVDKSFLSEEYLQKIQERYLNLGKKELEKLFSNDSLLRNGSFETWSEGPFKSPDFFNGDSIYEGMLVREEKEVKVGKYSVKIKGDNFNFCQNLPQFEAQKRKRITCFAWIKTHVVNKYRIQLYDGIDYSFSERHSGLGNWELLQVSHTVNPAAKFLKVRVIQAEKTGKTDNIVYIDGALLLEGSWRTFDSYRQFVNKEKRK